jgi:hypothetical protein
MSCAIRYSHSQKRDITFFFEKAYPKRIQPVLFSLNNLL